MRLVNNEDCTETLRFSDSGPTVGSVPLSVFLPVGGRSLLHEQDLKFFLPSGKDERVEVPDPLIEARYFSC